MEKINKELIRNLTFGERCYKNGVEQEKKKIIEILKRLLKHHEGLILATKFDFNVSVTHQNFCINLKDVIEQIQEDKKQ